MDLVQWFSSRERLAAAMFEARRHDRVRDREPFGCEVPDLRPDRFNAKAPSELRAEREAKRVAMNTMIREWAKRYDDQRSRAAV